MEMLALIMYAAITLWMVLYYTWTGKGKYYEFPFWTGVIAAGWFLPQAIGGYREIRFLPDGAYATSLAFAAMCNALLWIGYEMAVRRRPVGRRSWLDDGFDVKKLYMAGAAMCLFGFFFELKLSNLPDEVISRTQWTGIAVVYLFFSNVYYMGFVTLWLLYLNQRKWLNVKLLIFIVPALLMLLTRAVVGGRRSVMMNLFSYVFVSLWFVRRLAIPRILLVVGLCLGLLLVNSIGIYRSIMRESDMPLSERLSEAVDADYVGEIKAKYAKGGHEFRNYVHVIALYSEYGGYDYGGIHWNDLVFSYVPAQFVGREFKDSLMIESAMSSKNISSELRKRYNYNIPVGTTISGYADSFGSFWWVGCVKFLLIGLLMGCLYRHGIHGSFLGQMLYVFTLGTAMHAVSHGTNRILTSVWVYFFALGYPALYFARHKIAHQGPGNTHA